MGLQISFNGLEGEMRNGLQMDEESNLSSPICKNTKIEKTLLNDGGCRLTFQ
jgi:hypothetical protein